MTTKHLHFKRVNKLCLTVRNEHLKKNLIAMEKLGSDGHLEISKKATHLPAQQI